VIFLLRSATILQLQLIQIVLSKKYYHTGIDKRSPRLFQ